MESKYRPEEPYFLSTSSLSSLNLTGQVARFAALFGEVLIATVPVYELKWLYVRESDKISINYETLEEKGL